MAVINLGSPAGPRLRDLTYEQEKSLNAWLTLALVSPPSKWEDMPVDYTRALAALAKRRGIRFKFTSHEMRLAGNVPLGKNIPGCVGGSKRRVVVTDERRIVHGRKVEPWNMRDWRE